MAAPPKKKSKESTTISMVVEKWKKNQTEQFSAVHRINGYPWRLRISQCPSGCRTGACNRHLDLICEKSKEADLWICEANIQPPFIFNPSGRGQLPYSFKSWAENTHCKRIHVRGAPDKDLKTKGSVLELEIQLDDGEKWRRRPTLDPFESRDGTLVIGEEKKKIYVNKRSLASQSSFFDQLFYGNFKEKNMVEIAIGDVEYKELSNLLKIVYGSDGFSLTDGNVSNVLHLSCRFDLKIVEDMCVNYLLSGSTSLSIQQKLFISEENNLPFLKDRIISRFTDRHLRVFIGSPMWNVLTMETTNSLLKRCCDIMESGDYSSSEPNSE